MQRQSLEGALVVDFTTMVAGPWCTRLLADSGAEVVKIESAESGDPMRLARPIAGGDSRSYAHFNCGKKSLSIDLKNPSGIDIARRLVDRADIVVENFRPGVMKRFGLDYASVSQRNPGLVYCSVSGFGQTGELANRAAYAPVVHAYSGYDLALASCQGGGEVAPAVSGIMIADFVTASYAFGAIMSAMLRRERQGAGSFVDVTLMDSMVSLMAFQYAEAQGPGNDVSWVFPPFRSCDGYVTVPLISERTFHAAYKVIGKSEWISNVEFGTMEGISRNRVQILSELESWISVRSGAECERLMSEAGVPCSRYCSPSEQLSNPHLAERGIFRELSDSTGSFRILNAPFKMSGVSQTTSTLVSKLGEHNKYVVTKILEGNDGEYDRLEIERAFG
ncbi:CoA transferase [Pandoraea fibrosis]|uniref:CoA transferase n=1 Tax=Pandoraea fibrosis TaxID=1891094 RepID=A0ABX6HVH7_9BURK|nr:CoA transferase [Pandoraea fibrosis]QHE91526.1 CoA transferase [Pandoraea fibrosis]QHF14916.1 CoA transferase [Pandoraea fibrosis]